ncbi:hypothetical protein [Cellulomonas olei]|uniref:hypothetical protein n=1 Tax=Cellulomonas sp. P4 TaxID=3142533 RepID=UPI0031BA0E6A
MRIRLSLTLDVTRARHEAAVERDTQVDALVERAEPQPIGFAAEPGRPAAGRAR